MKVDCYDWDSDGSHDFIGQFTTNLSEMEKAGKPNEVMCNYLKVLWSFLDDCSLLEVMNL